MAINNIPGVGPANSDIATAVATAVPTIGEITSAVTSNAASAGVTMTAITNAITSNAASAGVTMAAITSAITTNAASAGVTMAAINSAVASNASPFGGVWTQVANVTPSGVTSVTISGLNSYKYLRVSFLLKLADNNVFSLRLNNDSTTNIYTSAFLLYNGNNLSTYDVRRQNLIGLQNQVNWNANTFTGGRFEIYPNNSTNYTSAHYEMYGATSSGNKVTGLFNYDSTAIISSMTFFSGSLFVADGLSRIWVEGAN